MIESFILLWLGLNQQPLDDLKYYSLVIGIEPATSKFHLEV